LKPQFQLLTIQQGYPRRYRKNIGRLTTAFGGGDGDGEAKRLPRLEVPSGVPDPEGILDDGLKVDGPVPTFSISCSLTGKNMVA